MEETIEARISPETVWRAWEHAYAFYAKGTIAPGQQSKSAGFKYKIFDVVEGERFSILWKSLFVRMIFTHSVRAVQKGSEIRYTAEIKGIFAWPVRFMLKSKIQKNLSFVLKEFAKQLETSKKQS